MAVLGQMMALAAIQRGKAPLYCKNKKELPSVTAEEIAKAAFKGDRTALEVFARTGKKLGEGLAVLMDVLNPDGIALGSIFARCESLLRPAMEKALEEETLPGNRCPVLPAALGEQIGDVAAVCVAMEGRGRKA